MNKINLVIFCNVNRNIAIMVKTGKFISNTFNKVLIKKTYQEAVETCLQYEKSSSTYMEYKEDSLFDEIWGSHREILKLSGTDYKIIRHPDWSNDVHNSLSQSTYIIDHNIFIREIRGIIRKGDMRDLGASFLTIKNQILKKDVNCISINDLSSLDSATLSGRKEVTDWYISNSDLFSAIIFYNITPSLKAQIHFAARTHPAINNLVYTAASKEDALLLALNIKYKNLFPVRGKPIVRNHRKKDIVRENILLKKQLEEQTVMQKRMIEDLVSTLGRVTWDETFSMPGNIAPSMNDPFFDLYMTVKMVVSDIHEIFEEKKELLHKAQEADRLKSAFLANMSHEIRTPLNGILGFAELLTDLNLPASTRLEYIRIINNNGHHLLDIINDIIDLSKIEAGQMTLNMEMIPVNNMLFEIQSMFIPKIMEKNTGKVELLVSPGLPTGKDVICTAPVRLRQILINLINNALNHTETGKINIGYIQMNNQFRFHVTDTGKGMSKEHQTIIFDRFMQIDRTVRSNKNEGAGLGLAITSSFVKLLGGKIWVESVLGEGSKFYFTIPLSK